MSVRLIIRIRSNEAMQRLQVKFWQNACFFFPEMSYLAKSFFEDFRLVIGKFLETETIFQIL